LSRIRCAVLAPAAVLAAACEFGEVTIPAAEPIVVVQAVMRPDLPRQWVLVEQTLTGATQIDSGSVVIPGDTPQLPITGASVTVRNRSATNDPCGAVQFVERPGDGPPESPGVYWAPRGCPTMRPDDTLELRVTTPAAAVVGTTVVPAADRFVLAVGSDTVTMPGPRLDLNRDTDTLFAEAVGATGRMLQIEVRRPDVRGASAPGFWIVVDSTAMTVPGNLPDIFTAFQQDTNGIPDEFPPVFAAGRYYAVTVAHGDERYFDFVRSGNIPPSGRGFVNRLEGGLGVFASLIAKTSDVRVLGTVDDPREGLYRLSGTLYGAAIDASLDLYVATAGVDSTDASAFVGGAWLYGAIDASADGAFVADTMALVIRQVVPGIPDSVTALLVTGPVGGGAGQVAVFDASLQLLDSLAIVRP
jgi:hypothetical protein